MRSLMCLAAVKFSTADGGSFFEYTFVEIGDVIETELSIAFRTSGDKRKMPYAKEIFCRW